MCRYEQAIQHLITKLISTIDSLVSIYRFKRELSLFDTILENRHGLLLICKKGTNINRLTKIDEVYDEIQDQYGWPEGVRIANSFSRGYVRTTANLWEIDLNNPRCLLPEDMLNLINTGKLVFGVDILQSNPLPHTKEKLLSYKIGLTRFEAKEIAKNHPEFAPLIEPSVCWARHEFAINHKNAEKIIETLNQMLQGKKPKKHVHIYGRYGGSGKTQIVYSLIKECKKKHLPFIYRTGFWKDEKGEYIQDEDITANKAKNVSKWFAEKIEFNNTVLFVDEVDLDLDLLDVYLAQTSKSKLVYYIISVAKELSDFIDDNFVIYDINIEYQFTNADYRLLLDKLFDLSNIDESIFPQESKEIIIKETRFWNHISFRRSPMAVILAASLAFNEAVKEADKHNTKIQVSTRLARKWAILGTSPLFQKYDEIHDVHAEYLIYDGKKYSKVDPFYNHPLP